MRLVQSNRMLRLRAILVDPETLPYLHALGQLEPLMAGQRKPYP